MVSGSGPDLASASKDFLISVSRARKPATNFTKPPELARIGNASLKPSFMTSYSVVGISIGRELI